MAAIGVRCSLSLPTATKAMTWTIACGWSVMAVVAFLAISIIAIVWLMFFARLDDGGPVRSGSHQLDTVVSA